MTVRETNLKTLQTWYETYEGRGLDPTVIVVLTRLEGTGRGSSVPVGRDLGLVYEFHDGLAKRLTAYGSHDEAFRTAEEKQHA